ncbi:MAG TPA: AmiS/UreI family transporter [Alphaproteobacteria bacterium]|nr:AmiS/UreI family transporter [Alphaproteobacteria bacterium]HQS93930.1 AmiS/UreI family transporter [Alphaproteobacteria bacterium]
MFLSIFFVGVLTFLVACHLIFREAATNLTIRAEAFTLLFSCTYLWVSFNHYREASDERGLGWCCLSL